jgi:hypothetical protein
MNMRDRAEDEEENDPEARPHLKKKERDPYDDNPDHEPPEDDREEENP